MRPGRTIVCGTEQGLYCRAYCIDGRELVVRATTEDGTVTGPHRLDLNDPEALLRCLRSRLDDVQHSLDACQCVAAAPCFCVLWQPLMCCTSSRKLIDSISCAGWSHRLMHTGP